jgi:hypothetical protein
MEKHCTKDSTMNEIDNTVVNAISYISSLIVLNESSVEAAMVLFNSNGRKDSLTLYSRIKIRLVKKLIDHSTHHEF